MATIKGNDRGNALVGTDAGDVIFGLGGADRLSGGAGQDVLYGDDDRLGDAFGAGDDRLDGGAGRDLLIGGAGADRLAGGDGDDLLIGGFATNAVNDGVAFSYGFAQELDGGHDSYDGGAGFDVAILTLLGGEAIALDISSPALRAITADGVQVGTIRGVEAITAFLGAGDDAVTGGGASDELHGGAGDDLLAGGAGSDRIDGGVGDDDLRGGDGFDTLSYNDAAAGVHVDLRLVGQAQDTRGGGVDTISGFEQVDGSTFSDQLIGGDGNDFITAGNGGSDRLSGGAGDDQLSIYRFASDTATRSTLNGGNGADVFVVGAAAGATDWITVLGGSGADTAYVTVGARETVNLGGGEDRAVLTLGAGDAAITLGGGVDTVDFRVGAGLPDVQTPAHIRDFAAGENGDRIDLRDLLAHAATGYAPASNPFASGFVRLVASGGGTGLQFDADGRGTAHGFGTILEIDGVAPSDFTAFNFGGTDPSASLHFVPAEAGHWPPMVHLA